CHILRIHALHPPVRWAGRLVCDDSVPLVEAEVSFQYARTSCGNGQLAYRRAASDAQWRIVPAVHWAGGSSIPRGQSSAPTGAGAGLHDGNRGWIHPHRVDGGRLSTAYVIAAAGKDQFQRHQEDAMKQTDLFHLSQGRTTAGLTPPFEMNIGTTAKSAVSGS